MAKISEIMLLQQPEQPALAIEVKTDMKGMSQAIGENFVRIDSLFKKQGEVTTDIPFVEYPDFESLTEDRIEMIIGLKSSKPLQGDEKIQSVILPARRIVVCLHRGNYNELAQLYNEMTEWIKTNGYKASGTSIEYYTAIRMYPKRNMSQELKCLYSKSKRIVAVNSYQTIRSREAVIQYHLV